MEFEIPYNFDFKLIEGLYLLQYAPIYCIYMPPYPQHYSTIIRTFESQKKINNLSLEEYEQHIKNINNYFPGKIQIILQNKKELLNENLIKYYSNLNIKKFCVASIEQAKLIKKVNSEAEVIGSIAMFIDKSKLESNLEYKKYFNGFVLPFKFCRNIEKIKELPEDFKYILLVNSSCSVLCNGQIHWNYKPITNRDYECPFFKKEWKYQALIRPMDLYLFDNYISVFKLQDRSWSSDKILREYILYSSNYTKYPGIIYDENLYKK